MNNNSSKQILLSVLGVAILVVAVVGVSFAAFTYTRQGEKENAVTTGTIKFEYTEGTNQINIEDAMPMDETSGKSLSLGNQRFDFTIKATTSSATTINYSIAAEKIAIQGPDQQLEDQYVDFYLTETEELSGSDKEGTGVLKTGFAKTAENTDTGCPNSDNIMELKSDSFSSTATKYYTLRMWLDESYGAEDTEGESFEEAKKFTVKVKVYAKGTVIKDSSES